MITPTTTNVQVSAKDRTGQQNLAQDFETEFNMGSTDWNTSEAQRLIYEAETTDFYSPPAIHGGSKNQNPPYKPISKEKLVFSEESLCQWWECVNHQRVLKTAKIKRILSGLIPTSIRKQKKASRIAYTADFGKGLSESDFEEYSIECWAEATALSKRKAMTRLAVLNVLIYHAAKSFNAFRYDDEGKIKDVDRDAVADMCRCDLTIRTASKHVQEVISNESYGWVDAGVFTGKDAIASAIEWLRDRGVLDWAEMSFKAGVWGLPRLYNFFDLPKALILAKQLEVSVGGMDALPFHKAATIHLVHGAVFMGWERNRAGEMDTEAPETWVESDMWRSVRRRDYVAAAQGVVERVVDAIDAVLRPSELEAVPF